MKNVVAYCRVSTDGQAGEDKFGIESQKQQIIEYCKKHDMEISDWFIDEGISGASKERPQFDRLLCGEILNPPVEAVVVAKADRIARDINIYYWYKSELNRLKLELISASEDWSAQDKLTGMILENFLAMAATLERESIKKRTMGGRKIKSGKGGYSGGRPPFGYKVKEGELQIVPDESEIVKTIFRMKDQEKKTYQQVRDYLNSCGFTNRSGTKFSISTVQTIYENKNVYLGMYRYGGKNAEWVKGQQEAILKENG